MKRKKKIAVIQCNGGNRARVKAERGTISGDCTSALEHCPEGILECSSGCLGLGSCAASCRLNAIYINDFGLAEVDEEICVGCGLCVKACPQNLIKLVMREFTIIPRCSNHDKAAAARTICEVSCIGCGICERNCPADAIEVIDNCAVIDEQLCISCGMCAVKCPRGTIVDRTGIFSVG